MNCAEIQPLLNAWFDGELDAVHSQDVERHLTGCSVCAGAKRSLESLRTALRGSNLAYRAPASLREAVRAQITANTSLPSGAANRPAASTDTSAATVPPSTGGTQRPGDGVTPSPRGEGRGEGDRDLRKPAPTRPRFVWFWKFLALGATAFAAILLVLRPGAISEREQLANEIVTAHVRSLMADNIHLTDVVSSDQHTVKPWFTGKLDFAPNVKDFTAQGFLLVGGRLDFLHGRPVAALVYRRNKHLINVFIWPSADSRVPKASQQTLRGYSLINREIDGLQYSLISDLNSTELSDLANLIAQ